MAVDVGAAVVVVVKHPKKGDSEVKMIEERQGIFIWFAQMKNLRQIKKLGHLVYASKKMKYALLYVNRNEIETVEERLNRFSFVSKTERSAKPLIETTYETDNLDDEKQFQYRMGI